MSKAAQIREYFRQMGQSTSAQCAKALALPVAAVRGRVHDLRKKGWLVRCGEAEGIYAFHQLKDDEHGQVSELQKKMWRAVRISKSFRIWDIAQLSGATEDYVKKYVSFLMKKGCVQRVGRDGQKAVYRRAKELPASWPRMQSKSSKEELARQDLLDVGWMMMRAIRDGDTDQALFIHDKIGEKLQAVGEKSVLNEVAEAR